MNYEALLVILACCIVIVVVVLTIFSEDDFCEPYPVGYELTGSYCSDICACLYETTKGQPYHVCVEEFVQTQNHGLIKIMDTCKRQDLNYALPEE